MPVATLQNPSAAAMDDYILTERCELRSSILCATIAEGILALIIVMSSLHVPVWSAVVLGAIATVVVGATIKHFWSNDDMERRRFCNCMGPTTFITMVYRLRFLTFVLSPAAIGEVGIWLRRHMGERKDSGGMIACAVITGVFSLVTLYQVLKLNKLVEICKFDQRMTFAERFASSMPPPRYVTGSSPYGDENPTEMTAVALHVTNDGNAVIGVPLAADGSPLLPSTGGRHTTFQGVQTPVVETSRTSTPTPRMQGSANPFGASSSGEVAQSERSGNPSRDSDRAGMLRQRVVSEALYMRHPNVVVEAEGEEESAGRSDDHGDASDDI